MSLVSRIKPSPSLVLLKSRCQEEPPSSRRRLTQKQKSPRATKAGEWGLSKLGESVVKAPLPGPGLEAWTVKTNPGRHRSDGERRMATTRNSGRSNGNGNCDTFSTSTPTFAPRHNRCHGIENKSRDKVVQTPRRTLLTHCSAHYRTQPQRADLSPVADIHPSIGTRWP